MGLKQYRFDGERKLFLSELATDSLQDGADKTLTLEKTVKNQRKIRALQDRLYADGKEGLVIILQARDAAGKDSTIRHVMSGINPQGVCVTSFKQPSPEELAHDFLWRAVRALPERGKIAIFNRSYYEDVLVVKVRGLYKHYNLAERCLDDATFFDKRYRHIRHFEQYLYDNGIRVLKLFLNVSPEAQKKRFLERIDDRDKNWKFSAGDLEDRELWDEFSAAYEDAVNLTATPACPWYVLPADQKWYTRYLVSKAVLHALQEIDPQYPELSEEEQKALPVCRQRLESEAGAD